MCGLHETLRLRRRGERAGGGVGEDGGGDEEAERGEATGEAALAEAAGAVGEAVLATEHRGRGDVRRTAERLEVSADRPDRPGAEVRVTQLCRSEANPDERAGIRALIKAHSYAHRVRRLAPNR